jgi:hypothetical protein
LIHFHFVRSAHSSDLAIFALKEKYWNVNAVINILMDPSDRQLLTEKAVRAGVQIHPGSDGQGRVDGWEWMEVILCLNR